MLSELSVNNAGGHAGAVLYDGACGVCSAGARRWAGAVGRAGLRMVPLQSPEARALSGRTDAELRREMTVVTPDRRVYGGVDAVLYVARRVPCARPVAAVAAVLPRPALDAAYRWLARNRYRLADACGLDGACALSVPKPGRTNARRQPWWHLFAQWAPAAALVAAAVGWTPRPVWVHMLAVCAATFAGLKWATWWPHRRGVTTGRALAYLLADPGFNAPTFLHAAATDRPHAREILAAAVKLVLGLLLVTSAAAATTWPPPVRGWAGMIGICLALHFGALQLVTFAWRRAGRGASPLMDRPLRAASLADFWSRRWNRPFRDLAHDLVFRPLAPRVGAAAATAAVFLFSGVVHDLAISVPARGGYGLPTLYFATQGIAVLLERRLATRPAVRRGLAVIVVLAPLPLLFHGPFVRDVVVPLLDAIRAGVAS